MANPRETCVDMTLCHVLRVYTMMLVGEAKVLLVALYYRLQCYLRQARTKIFLVTVGVGVGVEVVISKLLCPCATFSPPISVVRHVVNSQHQIRNMRSLI